MTDWIDRNGARQIKNSKKDANCPMIRRLYARLKDHEQQFFYNIVYALEKCRNRNISVTTGYVEK